MSLPLLDTPRALRAHGVVASALALACIVAASQPITCRMQSVARVYLGANTPDGVVDDRSWQAFVDEVVAPRFEDRFTVLDAQGRWRMPDGARVVERSRVLEVVGDDDAAHRQAIVEVAASYRARFRQDSVLITESPTRACV